MKRGRKPGGLSRFKCCECGKVELVRGGSQHFRCHECKTIVFSRRSLGDASASNMVGKAVRNGILRPATDFCCADCGKPATEYDHRDYNEPLRVEPVCRSCNLLRGPAIPRRGYIEWAISKGFAPYRQKARVHQLFVALGKSTDCINALPARIDISHWRQIWPELVDVA